MFTANRFSNSPSSCGISPLSWFESSLRILSFFRRDIDLGINPRKSLWDMLLGMNTSRSLQVSFPLNHFHRVAKFVGFQSRIYQRGVTHETLHFVDPTPLDSQNTQASGAFLSQNYSMTSSSISTWTKVPFQPECHPLARLQTDP
ncbi:hypothetical protein HanRHA438_Chr01g0033951 [Helianthus annuus]|nr:hypothetical protein HanRHA438_Chr01g0033951 [Helianthus annuus]